MSEFFRGLADERNRYREACARAMADLENLRAEARRQAEDAERRGAERVITSMLPALDSMERAVEYGKENPDPEALLDGLELMREEVMACLESAGLERVIPSPGHGFDPSLMEAIGAAGEGRKGKVAEVIAPGYLFRGRLIRPARVVVEMREENIEEDTRG